MKRFLISLLLTEICGLAFIAIMWWVLSVMGDSPIALIAILSVFLAALFWIAWREINQR